MTSSPPSHTRARTWLGAALRLGASGLILALLFHFLPFEQLLEAVERVPLGLWLTALGGYLAAHAIGVLKWRLMINLAGAELSFLQAAQCYFTGLCATLFLPSIVGGDVVRLGLALRLARNRAGAVLGSVFDRLLDLTALVGVAAAGAIWLHSSLNAQSRKIFWMVAGGVTLVLVALLTVLTFVPSRRFPYRMRRHFARLRQAARSISRQPQYVALALGLGVTVQIGFVLLTAAIAAGCGLHVPLRAWLFAWPLAKLSALLPVTQGGIGVREVALAALVAPFGAAPVLTVAVGLVWEAIILAGGLLAGLASFVLSRAFAPGNVTAASVSSAPAEE